MSAIRGSVQLQVDGIELFTRHSLNVRRASGLSTFEEIEEQERISVNDKHWSLKLLKNQFRQNEIEDLYKRYDNKLKLGYLSMFIIILLTISIVHLTVVTILANSINYHVIVAIVCYILQSIIPVLLITVLFIEKIVKKFLWMRLTFSIIVLFVMLIFDILVCILNNLDTTTQANLRPANYTNTLLACYIFLPIVNTWLAFLFGIIISVTYLTVFWLITYSGCESVYREIGGDVLYMCGVNFVGIFYRLMNEIVSRRSFLDRRAFLESNLRLQHEKDREERLLTSIVPEHIISVIRNDISKMYKKIQKETSDSKVIQDFSHFYVSEHENVSILYADVVNYTTMTTKLPPHLLIETLNELFGRFDEASEEHDVLRIKFLGDCYYCVSGMPKPNPQHAKSCIDLGLEMISIIKDVRESRNLAIDMRIGIHSGRVSSGLIGMNKWQYDIWSKDVTIANKMESTGKAGKVHITNKTLEQLGDWTQQYIIEPNFESRKEPLLVENNLETYLVSNPSRHSADYVDQKIQFRRVSVGLAKKIKKGILKPRLTENSNTRSRTTAFIDNNLMAYRQMLKDANRQMEKVIDNMPSGIFSCSEYTKEDSMNPHTLLFRKMLWEKSFVKQPDLLFKYFIFANLIILILNMGITAITVKVLARKSLIIDGILAIVLIILQPLNWTKYFWTKFKGNTEPQNRIIKFLYKMSEIIVWSATTRSLLYIFVNLMLSTSSLVSLTECNNFNMMDFTTCLRDETCIAPWHLAQACFLTLLMCFLFSRVFFLLKWGVGLIITGVYLWIVWDYRSDVFKDDVSWNIDMDSRIAHTLAAVFLAFTLHLLDRQTEFRNRLDHKWKKQLTEKQEDAATAKLVNNMLLHNILPAHVAEIYLNTSRSPEELYCEQYTNVAVIFASLTDYKFLLEEGDSSEMTMLKFLNQVILDFDKLLLSQNNVKVEKIKMAGWTYMAACGLEPSRRFSVNSNISELAEKENNEAYENSVVYSMVRFAADMMLQLKNFNRSSFQNMNLRVGVSHGMVTAGVVGSSKPLYDIWGNAVNMASRMDSTGLTGKIQVTENTAIVLDRQGILTQYRGKTYVKGVDYVRTYFVPLDEKLNLINKDIFTTKNVNNIEEENEDFEESNIMVTRL